MKNGFLPKGTFAAAALLSLVGTCGLTSGCGSSSSSDAFAQYEGTWKLSPDTSRILRNFHLVCPDLPFDDQFTLFTEIVMNPGTTSDLYETAGPGDCQFGFNVVPKLLQAAIVNPDPFTGKAPTCTLDLGTSTNAAGHVIDTLFIVTPDPTSWLFNLQPAPKGQAPRAQFVAHASIELRDVDTSVTPTVAVGSSTCMYDIAEDLDKVAKP